jgi:hypothetical protein
MRRPRIRPNWTYALAVLVAGGCLYLAYELGRYQSGYDIIDRRRERAALAAQLTAERGDSD